MRKNSKGFTLVELLAVIVILAVIILIAVNAVLPQMQKARKKSFADEGLSFAKAAENAYVDKTLTGTQSFNVGDYEITLSEANENNCTAAGGSWNSTSSKCIKKGLTSEYVTKSDTSYKGCIIIEADGEGNISGKKIYLKSDKWKIVNVTADNLGNNLDKQVYAATADTPAWNSSYEQCNFGS